ncbi:hypothetical protein [Leptospira stimsonii]|uniref:Uncharacterized protein n=1 Tax=Leptospira stimsonii TaxID=2202203 RepID=A0ABY2NEZ5_9LEPT|nr:hypothetical protein [Leptospira stimsonii]TGK26042.1 hypothetical protein EHO98_01455 [Leptospira stimsonii]TGM22475.1 hypothetical protein EHQ90_00785 [Leptospira stimsonii]
MEQNHASIGITGAFGVGRSAVWFAFFSFLCYTIYSSSRENLIHSIQKMLRMHWAKQICIDLYLGLGISIFFIYLSEGSFWHTLFW